MSRDTGYHAPINVDALEHRDGAWMCSGEGMHHQQHQPTPRQRFGGLLVIAVVMVIIYAAVIAWKLLK